VAKARLVKPKRRCCRSGPRCKRCPVVCKRLAKQGLAQKRPDGRYVIVELVPKRALKAARTR
jgi:hypothetical protein